MPAPSVRARLVAAITVVAALALLAVGIASYSVERQRILSQVDEQLQLAQATGNGQGVLFATANRGEVLGLMGRIDEGLAALGQARQMAAQWGIAPMVQQLDQMIQQLRAGQN